jgi:hypothetical protein
MTGLMVKQQHVTAITILENMILSIYSVLFIRGTNGRKNTYVEIHDMTLCLLHSLIDHFLAVRATPVLLK